VDAGAAPAVVGDLGDMKFYVVCTTPRSGSNFLCRELSRRGIFGQPKEFFNFHGPMFRYASELGAQSFDNYIDLLLAAYASPNQVFGWKTFWFDFLFLRDMAGRLNRFQPLLHIRLERKDEVAQAVSFAYAQASNSWTSEDLAQVDLEYDRASIDRALQDVRWNREGWETYFRTHSIEPLRIDYDELTADPEPVIAQIAARLGLSGELPLADQQLKPLSAQREWGKAQWLQRYREETGQP
jgi:LPS sulfotransferase NodH